MGNALYLNSKRLQQVICEEMELSYNLLDICKTKRACMQVLKIIYQYNSTETLTNIDYYNLYDMCYVLCIDYDGCDYSQYRNGNAKRFIKELKLFPDNLVNLINSYCIY